MSRPAQSSEAYDSASPVEGQQAPSSNDHSPVDQNHDNRETSTSPELTYPSQAHRERNSESSYPSWLPARPKVPAPASTFSGGRNRKPTPRSVRIVRHQGSPERREPTDETRVGGGGFAGKAKVWSRAATAGISPETLGAINAYTPRPRFREPALHLNILRSPSKFARIQYCLLPLVLFGHIPLQTFFDFNAVFVLLQCVYELRCLFLVTEKCQYRVSQNPIPGIDGSGRNWTLATVAYIACWAIWLFGVTILYEVVYSFVRQWRTSKSPLFAF